MPQIEAMEATGHAKANTQRTMRAWLPTQSPQSFWARGPVEPHVPVSSPTKESHDHSSEVSGETM